MDCNNRLFLPLCLKLCVTKFRCINDCKVYGKIQIDAHFFPEGVLVLQAKLDFAEYYTIDQFIIASIPSNIVLADNIGIINRQEFLNGGWRSWRAPTKRKVIGTIIIENMGKLKFSDCLMNFRFNLTNILDNNLTLSELQRKVRIFNRKRTQLYWMRYLYIIMFL